MVSITFWRSQHYLATALALAVSMTASQGAVAQSQRFVCPEIEQRTLSVRLPSGTSREIRLRIVASEPRFKLADLQFCMSFDAENCGYMRRIIAATPPERPLSANPVNLHSLITSMFNRAGLNEAQRGIRDQLIVLAELDRYRPHFDEVSLSDLPRDLQDALALTESPNFMVLTGQFYQVPFRTLHINLLPDETLLVSQFQSPRTVFVGGEGGTVVFGRGNTERRSGFAVNNLRTVQLDGGPAVLTPPRQQRSLTLSAPNEAPSLTAALRAAESYCADRLRNRDALEAVAPGFREVSGISATSPFLIDVEEPIVICSDVVLDRIINSTLLAAGVVTVRQEIARNARIAAREIRSGFSDRISRELPQGMGLVPTLQITESLTRPLTVTVAPQTDVRDHRPGESVCRLNRDGSGFTLAPFLPVNSAE